MKRGVRFFLSHTQQHGRAAACIVMAAPVRITHTTLIHMAEHHTQGRQGQGARRHRNRNNQGRPRRHRMPRPESAPKKKPSLLQRILGFFGFGKKKDDKKNDRKEERKPAPQNVRVAKGRGEQQNNKGGNPAARNGKRRATSVPPTRNARLYVGNLSYEATESELEDLFKGFGHVRSVEIIYNTRTYKSKGYAFVEMVRMEDACKAAEVLHGQPFMGREMMVSAASERQEQNAEDDTPKAEPAAKPAAEAPAAEPKAESAAEAPAAEPAAAATAQAE